MQQTQTSRQPPKLEHQHQLKACVPEARDQHITQRRLKPYRTLGVYFLCLLCTGCRSDLNSVLDNYEYRIGNIFPHKRTTDQRTPDTPSQYRLPSAAELTLAWPESTISLLDSLKLSRCAAGLPIMKKNSTLGKFHSQSQRLILESEIIHLLPDCIKQQSSNKALATKLQTAYQEKTANQQRVVWSALFGSQEFQHFASLSKGMLAIQDTHVDINGPQALEYWFNVFEHIAQQQPIPARPLESSLQKLMLNPALGQWIGSTQATLTTLQITTEHIRIHQNLCLKPINPSDKKRIQTVFQLFFIKDIQPLVSRLNRLGNRLQNVLMSLHAKVSATDSEALPVDPQALSTDADTFIKLSNYLDHLFGAGGLKASLQQHFSEQVQAWQILLRHCQLLPGNSRSDLQIPTTDIAQNP
jgi:hypothetical protein